MKQYQSKCSTQINEVWVYGEIKFISITLFFCCHCMIQHRKASSEAAWRDRNTRLVTIKKNLCVSELQRSSSYDDSGWQLTSPSRLQLRWLIQCDELTCSTANISRSSAAKLTWSCSPLLTPWWNAERLQRGICLWSKSSHRWMFE